MTVLDSEEMIRYGRNILLEGVGAAGQDKLKKSKVCIIGAGGLGSPSALYCAAAGIGTIGIVDSDKVELSNLQRQILHDTTGIGTEKVDSASARIKSLNPKVNIEKHLIRIDSVTASECIKNYDFIIDATDNFGSKFCINDACVAEGKPFVHAGVVAFRGQAMTVIPGKSACYRCVFADLPDIKVAPDSSRDGILGSIAGVIGCVQATECVKYLAGCGQLLINRLFIFNGFEMTSRVVDLKKRDTCPACKGIKYG